MPYQRALAVKSFIGLAALTVLLTVVGILTRPVEHVSLFWPVNAILLGVLLRHPRLVKRAVWPLLYLSMLITDLLFGSLWLNALWMNLCNLALIYIGWRLLCQTPRAYLRLRKPRSALLLFHAAFWGAAGAATLALVCFELFSGSGSLAAWVDWFCEQFLTVFLLLPVILTVPPRRAWPQVMSWRQRLNKEDLLALLSLGLSLIAMLAIGGPGSIGFPLLPLLWCAMRFEPFSVSLLSMFTGVLVLVLVAMQGPDNLGGFYSFFGIDPMNSARLGIALLVLAPLAIVATLDANRHLLRRVHGLANRDALTGALNRRALDQRLSLLLEHNQRRADSSTCVLMCDLDHFKQINDRHGHATGDEVLRRFSRIARSTLRQQDLFARIGGEEFVAVLPGLPLDQAVHVAERLRGNVQMAEFPEQLQVTTSIGVDKLRHDQRSLSLEQRLAGADQALYRAKNAGRNCVITT